MGIHRKSKKKSDDGDEFYEHLDVCMEVVEQDLSKANRALRKSTSELQAYLAPSMRQLGETVQETVHDTVIAGKYRSFQIPSFEEVDEMSGLRLADMEEDFGIPFSKAHEMITQPMVMNGYGYRKEVGYEVDYDTSKAIIAILDEEESVQGTVKHESPKKKRFSLFRRS